MANPIIQRATDRTVQNMEKNRQIKTLPKPRSIAEVSQERLAERSLEALAPGTGIPELDGIIKGFIPGHLITLTGDTNVGKTTLACNFAVRVAKQNRTVLYFALEPENTVVDYIASVRQNKRFEDLTREDIQVDDGMIHVFGKDEVATLDNMIHIIDTIETKYDLIIIDHVGYFVGGGQNYLQEQSNAIKKLAALSKRKKVCVLIIAHLRKKMANQKKNYMPTSDDIAGSGAFKQDSTEVMIVTRDVVNPESEDLEYANTGFINVTKTKAGPNGRVRINFQEHKAAIFSDGELSYGSYRQPVPYERPEPDESFFGEVEDALF